MAWQIDDIQQAETVLSCLNLTETIEFYEHKLGFRLESVFPADDPRVAVMSGFGLRLRFDIRQNLPAGILLLEGRGLPQQSLRAPEGTLIQFHDVAAAPEFTETGFCLTRFDGGADWKQGRAGMLYRDLISDRLGGRAIASHIRI